MSDDGLGRLTTEGRNPASEAIDRLAPLEIVRLMNAEDARVADAVACQAEAIARAMEVIAARLRDGGRLVYLGAGTSGRLGVLDAAECPPTFNTPPGLVVGLIAGGQAALTQAIEGAEDRAEAAVDDLQAVALSARDVVVGIATSGRTPYVLAGLAYARQLGAYTIGLCCNRQTALEGEVDLAITPVVGPEVISGSTRLKAGTATKMVLNMLSTGAMVLLGKTYGNLMVDLRATNSKLRERSRRIVGTIARCSPEEADALLAKCHGEVKTAIVVGRRGVTPDEARTLLKRFGGHLRRALEFFDDSGAPRPVAAELVLGIDGGGTKTAAWLARRAEDGEPLVIGQGMSGASNPHAVGFPEALNALDAAVAAAFRSADIEPAEVSAAVLALAGSDRDENRRRLERWARDRRLARVFRVVHDAAPLLAAGTPDGWGVALIAGTGSFAFGRSRDGATARAGGWGYLLGDEGGAYAVALAGLRAAALAVDRRGPSTALVDAFMARLGVARPMDLIPAVYRIANDRKAIASLAEVVFESATQDLKARAIVDQAAADLAGLVRSVLDKLEIREPYALAVSGGELVGNAGFRDAVVSHLGSHGATPSRVAIVRDPVAGAVLLAAKTVDA
ncbi:MAG: N-acetylmuramic acid 6-phosphate etherase [Thermoguttaceae bacterium]|jgi:N-acetylmuramic acid 6-phosphate etherase|nr:N-acetylmuramic acid 6-phosphate etherase [Thermoguttaceae bacterium]